MVDMHYDVIVVGAGTAGCVLAGRLSQSGKLRVLLLEAGGEPSNRFVAIPAGFTRLFKSSADWAFESQPQTAVGRRVFIPRGKMLGGSSNMNAQMHQWCHPADFEGWTQAGCSGWTWHDVAPVFRAQENLEGGGASRGHDGPMRIAPNRNALPVSEAFVQAARTILGDQPHYNGERYEGAWIAELAHHQGRRFSAYDAYLKPALRRPNLVVRKEARVSRVLFENGRATGVTARIGSTEETHRARSIVLAAGAYGSPQILMHSGIGPAEALMQLGISVARDTPEVGQNLQDHPVAPLVFRSQGTATFRSAESPANLLRYIFAKRGMLASNAIEAMAFAHTQGQPGTPPNVEILFGPLEWRNQALEPPQVDAVSLAAAVVAPRSRGRVTLASADPGAAPSIDFGLLSDADGHDARALIAGFRLARRIAAAPPLAPYIREETFPGKGVQDDAEILDRLCRELQTVYHPACTCRMGADQRAVVNSRLQVQGVDGLYVADASVMPSVPRGHPNAVVAMIAQRASDWIAADL